MRRWGDYHGYDGYGDEELKKGWRDFCGRWEATRATRNERRSLVTADVDVDARRLTPRGGGASTLWAPLPRVGLVRRRSWPRGCGYVASLRLRGSQRPDIGVGLELSQLVALHTGHQNYNAFILFH